MNSENSKTSMSHVSILNLTDKIDLTRGQKSVLLSNLSIYYTWKNIKKLYNNKKFKISPPTWNDEFWTTRWITLNITYSRLFWWYFKKHGKNIDNASVRIYLNKIENRIVFKIITEHYLELLTSETMGLFGSAENKTTRDKNGKNVSHLEITKVIIT